MEQVTIHELLKFPKYDRYFHRIPAWEEKDIGHTPQWRLFVLLDDRWRVKDLQQYERALRYVDKNVDHLDDAAISHRRHAFKEPFASPVLTGHVWCPYCRRPCVFDYFENHHTDKLLLRALGMIAAETRASRRCSVCGITERHAWAYQRERSE